MSLGLSITLLQDTRVFNFFVALVERSTLALTVADPGETGTPC